MANHHKTAEFVRRAGRISLAVVLLLFLIGCASAPKTTAASNGLQYQVVKKERHWRAEQFRAPETAAMTRLALQPAKLADTDAHGLSKEQRELVANHAARSFCREAARFAKLEIAQQPLLASGFDAENAAARDCTPSASVALTEVLPTSRAMAGFSSLAGLFVPGPFRVPVGLGGVAAQLSVTSCAQTQFDYRSARGANALTNDSKVSKIGDAWQLAGSFGSSAARALFDQNPQQAGVQAQVLDSAMIRKNRDLCASTYGKVNTGGRAASVLLPLAPEAIDPGAPKATKQD
jgi:hypothetical protein